MLDDVVEVFQRDVFAIVIVVFVHLVLQHQHEGIEEFLGLVAGIEIPERLEDRDDHKLLGIGEIGLDILVIRDIRRCFRRHFEGVGNASDGQRARYAFVVFVAGRELYLHFGTVLDVSARAYHDTADIERSFGDGCERLDAWRHARDSERIGYIDLFEISIFYIVE